MFFYLRPKKVGGTKTDAAPVLFVVRCADLTGKCSNCATYHHSNVNPSVNNSHGSHTSSCCRWASGFISHEETRKLIWSQKRKSTQPNDQTDTHNIEVKRTQTKYSPLAIYDRKTEIAYESTSARGETKHPIYFLAFGRMAIAPKVRTVAKTSPSSVMNIL